MSNLMPLICSLLAALLLMLASCQTAATAPVPMSYAATHAGGAPIEEDLSLSFACSVRSASSPSEDIVLNIDARNISKMNSGIVFMDPSSEFQIELYRDWRPVDRTDHGMEVLEGQRSYGVSGGSHQIATIKPYEQIQFRVNLKSLFWLRQPGRYLVIVRKVMWAGSKPIGIGASATFTVGPPLPPEPYVITYPKLLPSVP